MSTSSKIQAHESPFSLAVIGDDKEFPLHSKSILIGRRGAEIILDDSRVSRCHALIEINKEGKIKVKDLKSKNGTYINNKRITENRLNLGDVLLIGKTKLSLQDNRKDKDTTTIIEFEDTRIGVKLPENLQDPEKTQKTIKNSQKLSKAISRLKMVDDALCDIVFDDSKFQYNTKSMSDVLNWDSKKRDYIDVYDPIPSAKDILGGQPTGYSLEVSTLLSGNLVSRDYLPLKNGTYYAGALKQEAKVIEVPNFRDKKKLAFIKVQNGSPFLLRLPAFKIRKLKEYVDEGNDQVTIEKDDVLSIEQGVTQLLVRYSTLPPILSHPPAFDVDKKDIKKVVGLLILVLVLASLSTFFRKTVEEPEEQKVSIIYKPKPKPTVEVENKFQPKSEKQSVQSEASKKASDQQSKQDREKKTVQKVAKTPTPSAPKPKSYQKSKKLKNLFRSLSSSSNAPRVVHNSSSTSTTTQSLTSSVQQVSGSGTVKASQGSPGKLGTGSAGSYDRSTGSKGLSSKRGVAKVAYKVPGAVISGSGIDRNLLAQILKELIPQFRHCYQRELLKNKKVEGVINLFLRIHGTGMINNIKVQGESASFSSQGNNCIKKAIATVGRRFPRPPKGGVADIKQPLDFSAAK